MNTCKARFRGLDAAAARGAIRWQLFLHRDVRDVLLTAHADTLLIVYRGVAQPAAWSETLTADGFPAPVFVGDATSRQSPRRATPSTRREA